MHLSVVRPSVRLSRPAAARRCCGFAAVGPACSRYRSIAARPALSGSRAAATPRGGRMPGLNIKKCKQTYVVKFRQFCCLSRDFATAVIGPSARDALRVRRGISDFLHLRTACWQTSERSPFTA